MRGAGKSGFAVVAAILCLACVFFWVRSYITADILDLQGRGGSWIVLSESGAFYLAYIQGRTPGYTLDHWPVGSEGLMEEELFGNTMQRWKPIRFVSRQPAESALILSHWFLTLILGIWPALWMWRRKQGGEELCKQCGYDLRATPDRCPECGEILRQPEE